MATRRPWPARGPSWGKGCRGGGGPIYPPPYSPYSPGSPPRANWSGGGPPQVHSTRHQTTPGPFAPGTGPPPCLFGPAPTHPRTFCPRHRTAPVPFRSGAHPPRTFCPRHRTAPVPFAPGTTPPDRFASRPRPLASRDHSHPASQGTLPRQLVRQWAFVPYLAPTRQAPSTSLYSPQAPSAPTGLAVGHPRSIRPGTRPPPDRPRAFSVRRPPAPGPFAPGPLPARRGTPQPGDARPGGHMRVRGQGRGPAEKIPVAVSRGAIHKSLPAGQLAQHPAKPRNRPSGRANGSPCGQLAPASARGEGPPRPLGGDLGSQKKEQWSPVGGWPTRYPFPPSKHPALPSTLMGGCYLHKSSQGSG
ncbi:hypothetical protein P170DRAFT_469070 [Aspergillus steynii IBT 23096]|uniref:Uncharacterized protein n=1 Tax=Aspergillus steynii IBT 23096 TaxID=1392250 RepID=A0A2I2FQ97_9EURO|nr:hypothetical protein P170DRAFT_469070 [Aspergillus steynii IBT 23096]